MTAPALPDLAQEIEREHAAAARDARSAMEHAIRCGELLLQAKAALAHGEWLPWLEANTTVSARQSQRYMRLASATLAGKYNVASHSTIDGALALLAERDSSHVLRVMTSSASPEWFTPPHIVDLVEATLGEIDLDPCWAADSPVRAGTTYTAADAGLAQPWAGRVYLNPPYGREISAWVERLVAEYEAGTVAEAIALVPARVETEWFRLLDEFPRCFVYGRLAFSNSENSALFPSAIVYLGRNVYYFAKVFGAVGGIWVGFDGAAP
jgi:DNA N-6-adenine-methyltransferase (Dam)/Protein of unknown function (DUF3102)